MLQTRAAYQTRLGYLASDLRWNVQATELSRHVLDVGLSLIATPEKVRHPLATRSARYLVPKRMSRPGARCRHCCGHCWSVSPGRSPNPPCMSPRNGLSMAPAVGWFRQPGPRVGKQVVEPATRIGHRPTVKVGLHLRYPPPRTHRHRVDEVALGAGVTIRWRVFRHYSLQSLLETTAVLRHVTGSPGLGLLRRLRPVPGRSADGVPSPLPNVGDVDQGADQGRFPCSLVDRSTEEAPDSAPATSPWLPRSTSPRPPHRPTDIPGSSPPP